MELIYCAGPLFNGAERAEMAQIAAVLERSGYGTFLPHRDGIEVSKVLTELAKIDLGRSELSMRASIFTLDTHQIDRSAGVATNHNGRAPDEGAIIEATIGWCSRASRLYSTKAMLAPS